MAENDGRDLRESALRVWKRTLQKDPAQARQAISAALGALSRSGVTHPFDLARSKAQMLNGVATPGEFGEGKRA